MARFYSKGDCTSHETRHDKKKICDNWYVDRPPLSLILLMKLHVQRRGVHREELAAPRPFDQVQGQRAPCSLAMRHIGSTGEDHGATNAVLQCSRLLTLDSSLCSRLLVRPSSIRSRFAAAVYTVRGVYDVLRLVPACSYATDLCTPLKIPRLDRKTSRDVARARQRFKVCMIIFINKVIPVP